MGVAHGFGATGEVKDAHGRSLHRAIVAALRSLRNQVGRRFLFLRLIALLPEGRWGLAVRRAN